MTVFGTTARGETVHQVTIAAGDLSVTVLTYGAIINDLRLAGLPYSLTLGHKTLAAYETDFPYHGALIGPVANRISGGRVRIDGMMYELERNEAARTHLHSGSHGTHRRVWQIADQSSDSVTLTLALADGDAGLPGERGLRVTYCVTAPATLTLQIHATTDEKTLMNCANHSYWNLDGSARWDGHEMRIAADHYLPVNSDTCPTGEIAPVAGTPMDFRDTRRWQPAAPALDHNFCTATGNVALRDVLWLTGRSGVAMAMATTAPGLQVYDGRDGDAPYDGIAIEAQHWPDAPHNPAFPSIMLDAGESYAQTTCWRFAAP